MTRGEYPYVSLHHYGQSYNRRNIRCETVMTVLPDTITIMSKQTVVFNQIHLAEVTHVISDKQKPYLSFWLTLSSVVYPRSSQY
ncbi:hypothetical protein C0J52_04064 [Blattella germanica]|nr:hypothetical protein C0J52_04064 [Blattella germanica]